jgi:hypothetical protein
LVAGAVLEGVPADRNRHHFYDPLRGSGLSDRSSPVAQRLADVPEGLGSLRAVFTGTSFDGTGMAATLWMVSPANAWGLGRLLDERERAASLPRAADRDAALARALIATGALLHVLSDLGEPAHVRNDFRVALEAEGAPLERFVAARYGREGVPAAGEPILRAHLVDFVHDPSAGGLADEVSRRFYSAGTLPPSLYPLPRVKPGPAASGYASASGIAHLAAYQREAGGVRWFLDGLTDRDYAQALLPQIGRYAAGLIDFLYRGRLELAPEGEEITVRLKDGAVKDGRVSVYAERAGGERRLLLQHPVGAAGPGEVLASAPRPAGATRMAAVLRGTDAEGEPLVIVQELPFAP